MEHYHPYTVDLMINGRLSALREDALRERMLVEARRNTGRPNSLSGVRQILRRALEIAGGERSERPVSSRRMHETS